MSSLVPHEYQRRVAERMIDQPHLGLFLDPGLGKTSISLSAFRAMREAADVSRMLVVAPLRVCYSVWPPEVEKWDDFRDLRVRLLHGPGKVPSALDPGAEVYVINPEGLEWLVRQRWRLPEMLVVDESTRFKRKSSKRSRLLGKLLDAFPRRYALTGTPAPNGLIDLHGQMLIVDRGKSLGRNVGDYLEEFFVNVPCGPGQQYWQWKPRRGATKQIYERIAPWVVRLDARDYLELPEVVTVPMRVDIPDRAMDLYQQLRREMVLELEEGNVVAMNAGALTGKCRQVANGSVYLTDSGDVARADMDRGSTRRSEVVHDAKAQALVDLVEELGGKPLLVAYEFRHEIPLIKKALRPVIGQEPPHFGGGVSATRGRELEAAWNRGDLPVLLVHPLSASHGLNLQGGGHHLAWYSLTWDLELYDQLVRRLWRQGQEERVFVYHLVSHGTIDGTVARVLEKKSRDQGELLDALREDLR